MCFEFGIFIHGIVYIISSFFYLKKESIKALLKGTNQWIKRAFIGISILWFIGRLSAFGMIFIRSKEVCPYKSEMYFLSVLLVIYIVFYFRIGIKIIGLKKIKYKDSILNKNEINDLYNIVVSYYEDKKPFLESDFSLQFLSKKLGYPVKQVSQAINSKSQLNFKSFTNNYRLKESKRLLLENNNEELSISEIYYAVGFNSKSTFNTLFKKEHGITPSQFRKIHT
ncbi:hypothetical protein GCM10022396_21660 [Flavivirga amylovorans]